ncbi:hypothetical protein V6N13_139804 [Hibiscus sabdariffa]
MHSIINPTLVLSDQFTPVASMVDGTGHWRWDELDDLLPEDVILRLMATKPPLADGGNDTLGNTDGRLILHLSCLLRDDMARMAASATTIHSHVLVDTHSMQWCPHPPSWLKLNCDGSRNHLIGSSACGGGVAG